MGEAGRRIPFFEIFGISDFIYKYPKKSVQLSYNLKYLWFDYSMAKTVPPIFSAMIGELGSLVLTVIVFLKTPKRLVS